MIINFFFFFCLLLILRFGDEVGFSAGFPARPVGSLGRPKTHPPGCSSYSVFLLRLPHHLFLWVGLGLPSGWLSGYQLADARTRTSSSVAQVPIFSGFLVTDLSPVERQRFLAKILHFDLSQKAERKMVFVHANLKGPSFAFSKFLGGKRNLTVTSTYNN